MLKGCSWKAHAASLGHWGVRHTAFICRPSLTHLPVLCRHVNVHLLALVSGTCSISQVPCSHESERCAAVSRPVLCLAYTVTQQQQESPHWQKQFSSPFALSLVTHGPRVLDLTLRSASWVFCWTFAFGVREGVLRNRTLQFIKSSFVLCKRPIPRKGLAWGQGKWVVNTGPESLEQYLFGLDFTGCKTC